MQATDPRRVIVKDGANDKALGRGTLIGYASLYAFVGPVGSQLASMENPEEIPATDVISEMLDHGFALVKLFNNPKIELDSGKTVYGCQVHWAYDDAGAGADLIGGHALN